MNAWPTIRQSAGKHVCRSPQFILCLELASAQLLAAVPEVALRGQPEETPAEVRDDRAAAAFAGGGEDLPGHPGRSRFVRLMCACLHVRTLVVCDV